MRALVITATFFLLLGAAALCAENRPEAGVPLPAAATDPITDPDPPSTLLPPGTTAFTLTIRTSEPAACGYAVGNPIPYDQMTPFEQGAGTTLHQTTVGGLNPDPNTVNHVYIRCSHQPDFVLELMYRSLSQVNPAFPRTGNLWGWWNLAEKGLPYLARMDLILGADGMTPEQIATLRSLNPHIRILTSINAVENNDVPGDDYFLKDVNGNKIEVWPGSYRLNLTKPYVAEYQAHYAYQTVLNTGLMADGVFFDNVFASQSWLTHDIYGNPVQIDADEDGLPDDPEALDAAWRAGIIHEMETFRRLMPYAIVMGHAVDIDDPELVRMFNGIGIGFATADAIEGERSFPEVWTFYHRWLEEARPPALTMIESSPVDQIAYGYDYAPWDGKIPSSTLEFARTYYPWMRFGLAFTLMGDGYFAHEFGDTWHGNDWWYDELDFNLGYPLGPAERVDVGFDPGPNRVENGDFEDPLDAPWNFWANAEAGCVASVVRDTAEAVSGTASVRLDITATSGVDWHVEFSQYGRSLEEGVLYDVSFWARSDRPRFITLSSQKGSPNWDNYGLWRRVAIGPEWRQYTVSFEANATVDDARLQFLVGEVTGTVWLDDVRLTLHPPDVYRREFTYGLVLLNATRETRTVDVGAGYRRLTGSQAPRFEFILDDADPVFSTVGNWMESSFESGEWQAEGPFYHDWGEGCHISQGIGAEARWEIPITASDTYTISVWWPAAPEADAWSDGAAYEVVADGEVVASAVLDQRTGGDEWHTIAVVPLSPEDHPFVRLRCTTDAPCIADALYVRPRSRYNDGSPAAVVTLGPMDGIILQRSLPNSIFLPLVLKADY